LIKSQDGSRKNKKYKNVDERDPRQNRDIVPIFFYERLDIYSGIRSSNISRQPFLAKSNVIDCKVRYRVLQKGNVAQNSLWSSPGCCQVIGD